VTVETVLRWSRAKIDPPLLSLKIGYRVFRRFRMSEVIALLERRRIGGHPASRLGVEDAVYAVFRGDELEIRPDKLRRSRP
jgi:hypothetical protein